MSWDYWYGLEEVTLQVLTINEHIDFKVSGHFNKAQTSDANYRTFMQHFMVMEIGLGTIANKRYQGVRFECRI